MQSSESGSPSRRAFIQATATAAAVTAAASSAQAAAEPLVSKASKTIAADVLVCGGGCAGTAAAIAAARQGAKVLLIEKAPFAGGIITCVGLPYFDGIANIRDNRIVVRGIALELLAKSGIVTPDAKSVAKHNPTIKNSFEFKLLLDGLFQHQKDNLSVLFNSFVCGVETSGDRISAVRVANKDGLVSIQPKVVIDCTGDADVAAWAGAPYEQNAEVQPLTLHFRIGRVKRNPDIGKNCREALAKAQQRGELPHYYGPGVI
jgi:flavin-dependent dehydrogenase